VSKRTDSPGLGSLGSGAVTGLALAVQTGLAAVVGVIVARELGRGAETDGFFAAFSIYFVVILSASAIRVVVLPPLARARQQYQLGAEVAAYAVTLGTFAAPLLVAAVALAGPLASLLTGSGSDVARDTAADALPWMVLAGVLQLYAGLAASTLAALDDYVVAAAGYALGSIAALVVVLARIETDGVEAVAWAMALNGGVAVLVPSVALVVKARREGMPRAALQPAAISFRGRVAELGNGVVVALALQAVYLVCVPLAGREGEGALTTFGYAYMIMSSVVAVSASSLGLVTSVPLTRTGLDAERAARHVVSSSWLAIIAVGAAAGVFSVAGSDVVEALLGASYGSEVGADLGRVVVALAPWAVVTVGSSVTFPLVFVAGRTRRLPHLAAVAFLVHVPLAILGQAVLGLSGLALALALTSAVLLGGALALLDAVIVVARRLAFTALVVAALVAGAFVPPALLLGATVSAAAAGTLLYAAALALIRPPALVQAWRYLRALT
jgi:hypothetical protein